MNTEPYPKQREFIRAILTWKEVTEHGKTWKTNRYSVAYYGGGIRGGKTYANLMTFLLLCRFFPGSRWAVVRSSIEDIRRTTLPSFYNLISPQELKQVPNASNGWVAILPNGSQIIFFSESYAMDKDLNRWRGLEVNGFGLEECNELNPLSFQKALERKGTWRMDYRWNLGPEMEAVYPSIVLANSNPDNGWVKDTFHDPFVNGTLNSKFCYIPALVYDNPSVSEDWIEEKRKVLTPYMFQKFVEGDWDISENDHPFITEFNNDWHLFDLGTVPILSNEPITVSLDFNVEPPTAIMAQRGLGFCHIFDECTLEKGSVYDLAIWIKTNYPGFAFKVTGDATGHSRQQGDRNLRNNYEIFCKELGISYQYDKLIAATSNPQINGPRGNRAVCNAVFRLYPYGLQVRIDRRCKKVIADINNARVDKMGDLVKNRDNSKYFMDSLDALRYLFQTWYGDIIDYPDKYLKND